MSREKNESQARAFWVTANQFEAENTLLLVEVLHRYSFYSATQINEMFYLQFDVENY